MNRLIRPWGLGPGRLVGRPRSGGAWQKVTDRENAFSLSVICGLPIATSAAGSRQRRLLLRFSLRSGSSPAHARAKPGSRTSL